MRIEKITFQAFGPYVDKTELATEELFSHHLFLIKGATGAGKTVILDAITFALYGKSSSGERGDFESMRSRFANDKQKTFVELIFSVKEHRYRFYREIAVGKKRNGDVLYKVNVNGGELIEEQFLPFFENCKITLLDRQAEKLIGLNHAQFIRTMILPQGKFERLLISNSEEKQEILKTLFQSERWAKLCDVLSEQLKKAKEKMERTAIESENLLAQAEVASLSECEKLAMQLKEQLIPMKSDMMQAKQTMESKQKQLEEEQHFTLLMKKKTTYELQLDELLKQEAEIALKIKQVETAKEYERILPYINVYREAQKHFEHTKQQLTHSEQTLAELQMLEQKLQAQSEEAKAKSEECAELNQRCELWKQQLVLCEERNVKKQEMQQLHQQERQLKAQMQKQKQESEQLKQQREFAKQQIAALENVREQYAELLVQQERCKAKTLLEEEIARQNQQLQEWKDDAEKRRQNQEALRKQEQQAQAQHEELYRLYLQDSAGLLAALLEEGKPCPICGSTHHPHPVDAKTQLCELEKLKECKQHWDSLIQQIQESDNWLKQAQLHQDQIRQVIKKQQASLKEKYYDLLDKDDLRLQNAVAQLQQKLQLLQEQKQCLHAAEAELPNLEHAYETISEKYQAVSKHLIMAEAQYEERYRSVLHTDALQLQNTLKTAAQRISETEAFVQTWEQSTKAVQLEKAALLSGLSHIKDAAVKAEREYRNAYQQLQLNNHLRLDIEQDILDDQKLKQQKTEILHYQEQLTKLQISIKETADQIKDHTFIPLADIKRECNEAETAYQHYVKEITKKEYRLEQIQQIEQRLIVLQKEYEAGLLKNARQSEFVKAMRGDTSIGIERYVLGIMLSQITQSANALLKNVHDGRYQLYRSDDTSGKVRKYGLEISIYDSMSGSMRSAASLSGGEKFLVSLALSLALSTVVQARNSGVTMESLFIDEGFGSLDEASIADALQVLSCMANSTTMIGIISHVELLKENIPYGIEVTKGKQGSTCRMLL